MMPSAACRPMRTIGWIVVPVGRVVEHALEQASGVPGAGRALGQGHALGDLDDPERRQLAVAWVEHGGAEPDQLLGRRGVGDRDEDPAGSGDFDFTSVAGARLVPAVDEVRLEQLELARLALDAVLGLVGRDVRGSR